MGNKIEQLAIAHVIAMQDAVATQKRYYEAIENAERVAADLRAAVEEEIARRRDNQE